MQSKLNRFMYGRYGIDKLSRFLIVCALILDLCSAMLHSTVLYAVALVPFILAVLRILSKNRVKRVKENYTYVTAVGRVKSGFGNTKQRILDVRTHKYLRCPHCKKQLRVPRGKGSLKITCPKCHGSFAAKS